MNTDTEKCACPDCICEISEGHRVARDGKLFCSDACADGHPSGAGCCGNNCTCHG